MHVAPRPLFHRFGQAILLHRPGALISRVPGIRRASDDGAKRVCARCR
jgi:hypothetical protein